MFVSVLLISHKWFVNSPTKLTLVIDRVRTSCKINPTWAMNMIYHDHPNYISLEHPLKKGQNCPKLGPTFWFFQERSGNPGNSVDLLEFVGPQSICHGNLLTCFKQFLQLFNDVQLFICVSKIGHRYPTWKLIIIDILQDCPLFWKASVARLFG